MRSKPLPALATTFVLSVAAGVAVGLASTELLDGAGPDALPYALGGATTGLLLTPFMRRWREG